MSADPYWNYVKLLCHFDGPDNGLRIVDERHNPITAVGNSKLSTVTHAPITGSNSSAFFDGTGDYLSIGAPAYTLGNLAALDFTLEYWVKPVNLATAGIHAAKIVSAGTLCFYLISTTAGGLNFKYFPTGGVASEVSVATPSGVLTAGVWSHVAVCREGATLRIFVNGVLAVAFNIGSTAIFGSTAEFTVGGSSSFPSNAFNGYIDEFRLTVGVCRYTADFTPAISAFPQSGATDQYYGNVVLHCHFNGENNSTTFVDQKGHTLTSEEGTPVSVSTTAAKFGGTSAVGNTTTSGGRINCGASADFVLGTGDFTIEAFVMSISILTNSRVCELRNAAGVEVLSLRVGASSNFVPVAFVGGVAGPSGGTVSSSSFWHLALVRQGTTLKLYANGTQVGTTYTIGATDIVSDGTLYICGSPSVGFPGYLDEIRITKGVARYTTNFTPPTEPFPDYALQKLTGTVFDAAGNPVAKTVRSYRTSDGLLIDQSVSDPTTGAFELRATDTTEHFVVVHDDTKNALVYDHIVPVI